MMVNTEWKQETINQNKPKEETMLLQKSRTQGSNHNVNERTKTKQ